MPDAEVQQQHVSNWGTRALEKMRIEKSERKNVFFATANKLTGNNISTTFTRSQCARSLGKTCVEWEQFSCSCVQRGNNIFFFVIVDKITRFVLLRVYPHKKKLSVLFGLILAEAKPFVKKQILCTVCQCLLTCALRFILCGCDDV